MITLTCTKCKTTLEMDDAFAGGVCRCQHCGTIQTVPSHLKNASRIGAGNGTQKALYSGRGGGSSSGSGAAVPSSGLDDLATAVASSGISSGLAGRAAAPTANRTADYAGPDTARPKASRMPLFIGIGIGSLIAIGALAFVFLRGEDPKPAPVVTPPKTPAPVIVSPGNLTVKKTAGPHFINTPIEGNRVVYVVDRGDSNRSVFDPLKAALYDSMESLGNDREFQILFWTRPATPGDKPDINENAYPVNGVAKANKDRIAECQKKLEDVTTSGSSEIGPAMQEAMKRKPDVIIIVTAKGISLDDRVVSQTAAALKGKPSVVIHTVDLTAGGEGRSALEAISTPTGGNYWPVSPTELRAR